MSIQQIGVAQSGNGLFTVTVTQDDTLHLWTAIHVVNSDTVAYITSGNVNGTPYSFTIQPSTVIDHTFSLPLIQVTNRKGQLVWIPSLDGTNPMSYSIGVGQA